MTSTHQIKDGSTLRHLKLARKISAAARLEVVILKLTCSPNVLHKLKTRNRRNVLLHNLLETRNLSKECQLSTSKCWTQQLASQVWLTYVFKSLMMNKMRNPQKNRVRTLLLNIPDPLMQRPVAVLWWSLLKSHFASSRTCSATLFSWDRQICGKNTCSGRKIRWTTTLIVLCPSKKSSKLILDLHRRFHSLGSLVVTSKTTTSRTQEFELRKKQEVKLVVPKTHNLVDLK